MAKRSTVSKILTQIERDARRSQREAEKRHREVERQRQAAIKEVERSRQAALKAAKQQHKQYRQQLTEQFNAELASEIETLNSILEIGLNEGLDFERLIATVESTEIPIHPGQEPQAPVPEKFRPIIPEETRFQKMGIGKAKRETEIQSLKEEAKQKYRQALAAHERALATYREKLSTFNDAIKQVAKNQEIVTAYYRLVLEQTQYPAKFPKYGSIWFNPETGEVIVEYQLPTYGDIIPSIKGYKYLSTKDEIQEVNLNKTDQRQMQDLYEDVIAAVALRTIHMIFAADIFDAVDSVAFNGVVETVDKATGQPTRPCLVSVHTSRDEFSAINLAQVDKQACLKHLKAQTSPSSKELVAIKPIVDLPKEDFRFVEEIDVISGLDSRPNLMEMTPAEFEHLIANLFSRIEGLTTNTTTISRDGGVDVIAYDNRPILGGKVIIQAKRYKNTVGVESVRALYGVMQDEGATKGILVTTSSFGTASREFAKGKPIELIDGNGLLYLLQENGFEAKIEIME